MVAVEPVFSCRFYDLHVLNNAGVDRALESHVAVAVL